MFTDDIGCSPGFYISVTGNCQPCPFGSYQSDSNQVDCVPCPGNLFTLIRAASDIAKCEGIVRSDFSILIIYFS